MSATIHATCVAVEGHGVLIEGPSGAGKSDLALRLIDRGAVLVSDDRTLLRREGDTIYLEMPENVAGLIEVRGLGIVTVAHVERAPLRLWVRLGEPERLPLGAERIIDGVAVPELVVAAREASAPVKVEWALRELAR